MVLTTSWVAPRPGENASAYATSDARLVCGAPAIPIKSATAAADIELRRRVEVGPKNERNISISNGLRLTDTATRQARRQVVFSVSGAGASLGPYRSIKSSCESSS